MELQIRRWVVLSVLNFKIKMLPGTEMAYKSVGSAGWK